MKAVSLRKRFYVNTAVVVAAVMAISLLVVDISYVNELKRSTNEKLQLHIFALLSVAQMDEGQLSVPPILHNPGFNSANSGLWAMVLDERQNVVWHSLSIENPPTAIPLGKKTGEWAFDSVNVGERNYLTATYHIAWDVQGQRYHYYFIAAENEQAMRSVVRRFRAWLFGGFSITTLTLLICQYVVLRLTFRPINALENEISQMEQGHQNALTGKYPKELRGVTQNLNALIDKEYRQREKYRVSMADLAHSLKTPLAILRAELADIKNNETIMNAVTRIDNSIEYQLRRAVISRHSLLSSGTQISNVVDMVVETLQKIYPDNAIDVQCDVDATLLFIGDENDLMEIFGNLLDNAFKHAKSRIGIGVESSGNQLTITVEDDGLGFSQRDAQRIFDRGERLDQQKLGQGIGLAVVLDIVKSYEGNIETGVSRWGGAMFKIVFSNTRGLE